MRNARAYQQLNATWGHSSTTWPSRVVNSPEVFVFGTDQIEFLAEASGSSDNAKLIRFFKQQFQFTDRDNNDYLSSGEVRRNYYFQESFDRMDADGDGKVFEKDMLAYLERKTTASRTRTLLNVDPRERNLFDMLDTSGNGRLGLRELVEASRRLKRWDANDDQQVSREEIPRQFRLQVTRGRASIRGTEFFAPPIAAARRTARNATDGPNWFRKMDTNNDGDISPREFLGTTADFKTIDADGDLLIDAEEASGVKSGS